MLAYRYLRKGNTVARVQTSPPRATKEIGDVCSQARNTASFGFICPLQRALREKKTWMQVWSYWHYEQCSLENCLLRKKSRCLISLMRQSKARSGVLPLGFLLSFLMPHQIQQYRLWLEPIRSRGTRRKQRKQESELLVRKQRSSLEIQWRIPA